jgi:potassium-dependent mechanosensitive channel
LQMIVSNFVSGIILLFEKPFQIGDYVEIGDKKGKIQDIGIRSSKMLTVAGAEIIIPNSDFLSNRLTNWTSNNDFLKSEITFKLGIDTDVEIVTKIVKEESGKIEGVLKNLSPDVLVSAISADSLELKVSVWITNIYTEAAFKSQLLQRLLARFKEKGIKMM